MNFLVTKYLMKKDVWSDFNISTFNLSLANIFSSSISFPLACTDYSTYRNYFNWIKRLNITGDQFCQVQQLLICLGRSATHACLILITSIRIISIHKPPGQHRFYQKWKVSLMIWAGAILVSVYESCLHRNLKIIPEHLES